VFHLLPPAAPRLNSYYLKKISLSDSSYLPLCVSSGIECKLLPIFRRRVECFQGYLFTAGSQPSASQTDHACGGLTHPVKKWQIDPAFRMTIH